MNLQKYFWAILLIHASFTDEAPIEAEVSKQHDNFLFPLKLGTRDRGQRDRVRKHVKMQAEK